jgi:ABC-type Mn2+/Zn2+ transport system ATPase subunit
VSLSNWRVRSPGQTQLVIVDDLLDGLDPKTETVAATLRNLMRLSGRDCGVLMSASDIDSALPADYIHALDGHGGLERRAGQRPEKPQIIPFPTSHTNTG